jgi:hypothetical protein
MSGESNENVRVQCLQRPMMGRSGDESNVIFDCPSSLFLSFVGLDDAMRVETEPTRYRLIKNIFLQRTE